MSLTSTLKGSSKFDKEFQKILFDLCNKDYFSVLNKNCHPFEQDNPKVPYDSELNSWQASIIGTAFDYCARFEIGKFLKDKRSTEALYSAQGFLAILKSHPKAKEYKLTESYYINLMKGINEYVKGREGNFEYVLETSVRLAKMEHAVRGDVRRIPELNLDDIFIDDQSSLIINQLRDMVKLFHDEFINGGYVTKKSDVIYNPHFGATGNLVGGADADIFIDGTLYDFKTSKDNKYKRLDVAQLLGYFLLCEINNYMDVDDAYYLGIDRLSFYKGRYGTIESMKVTDLGIDTISNKAKELAAVLINSPSRSIHSIMRKGELMKAFQK
ncbi:hypothetical protein ANABIO32_00630 [Rossellomorea marisflavi]|uniref:hypothetical protein n=1 Tax=Rossellomorea marisflavi TaxID=189381 RepID=UPI0025C84736|nr:hypothetical protein [Rossellomorea marisflavi]GLI82377.1 hypothetical protein ANABIO32_00630 [Rossellomorea marisflavi]